MSKTGIFAHFGSKDDARDGLDSSFHLVVRPEVAVTTGHLETTILLAGFTAAALAFKPALGADALLADVLDAITDRAFIGDDPLPRSESAFAEQIKRARTRLPAVAESAFRLLATIGPIADELLYVRLPA